LQRVDREIDELRELSEAGTRGNIDAYADGYKKLADSWRTFFKYFGVDQTKAITELAVRSEPLSQEVIETRMPRLQADENGSSRCSKREILRGRSHREPDDHSDLCRVRFDRIGVAVVMSGN